MHGGGKGFCGLWPLIMYRFLTDENTSVHRKYKAIPDLGLIFLNLELNSVHNHDIPQCMNDKKWVTDKTNAQS